MVHISTNISEAVACLNREEIIGLPTETVYGLAGNIYSEKAVRKIFDMKQRPLFNPLIVHIGRTEAVEQIAQNIPEQAYALIAAFWPGPLTLVLDRRPGIPDLITAGKNTVAVRMPNHPMALALLEALEYPLAAPSANPFGSISPTTAQHVADYFRDKLELVLDGGPCARGVESTIVGFPNGVPTLYRHGSTPAEDIEAVLGQLAYITHKENAPDAPGMLARHYAPATRTIRSAHMAQTAAEYPDLKIGLLLFDQAVEAPNATHQEILSPSGDLKEAAMHLYAAMHRLDQMGLDLIIAQQFPNSGLGRAINDRLDRAGK
ncbi:MAG TPA: L-threonylcarbamoyladenylate synthase [Saprospiraceae bacterium]|nr:L-threonylcarbamoyladenylate synthase [Saprospiraceae bacterium]